MSSPNHRALVALALSVALCAGAVLSGCSKHSSSDSPPDALTAKEAHQEFEAETERLALPADARWNMRPTQLMSTDETGQPQFYAKGIGAQTAQFQWYCAWGRDIVKATSAADRREGIRWLASFRRMSVWPYLDDNGRAEYRHVQREAQLGNLRPLQQLLERDCS